MHILEKCLKKETFWGNGIEFIAYVFQSCGGDGVQQQSAQDKNDRSS